MNENLNRRDFLRTMGLGATALALPGYAFAAKSSTKNPNVLFLAVDDLRPQLGCYGHKQMVSPNIDRLASEGVTFLRSYCQVPVCGASRASLLTGTRPTADRFLGYSTWAEKDLPGALSIAEHFRNNGYHTISNGKIFVPLLWNPDLPWKKAVFSRYFRGDSVKTDRYRYTQWRGRDGKVYARMLYDHSVDPFENVNIAELPQNKDVVETLSKMIEGLET